MSKKKSYVVFGAGRFGSCVSEELMKAGMEVLVVDNKAEHISNMADKVTRAVLADVTDTKSMEALGLNNYDGAIISISSNLAAVVMCVTTCKDADIPRIVCKVANETQAKIVKKLGADRVVSPEHDSGYRVARTIVMEEYLDVIKLSDTIEIAEMEPQPQWAGKSLKELSLPQKYRLNVIAVRVGGELRSGWDPDEPLPGDSSLVVVGSSKDLEKFKGKR